MIFRRKPGRVFFHEYYRFKRGESGLFVPIGAGALAGNDIGHKLYTHSAGHCIVIAGVIEKSKKGFLAHISPLHNFTLNEPEVYLEGMPVPARFGEINGALSKFASQEGKLVIIASDEGERVLERAKSFLEERKVSYETIGTGENDAGAVVDVSKSRIYLCGSQGSREVPAAIQRKYSLGGGMISVRVKKSTLIKEPKLIHTQFIQIA